MGRYDFRPIRVLQHANQLLETGRISHRPPWASIVAQIPPGETIVRPVKRFDAQPGKRKSRNRKSSRMFQPLQIVYPEDKLRTTFFNDHPWELARPKTVVENDGNDGKDWDWSQIQQPGKPLDGER
jgi:small subunit ribosomal protein S23